MKNALERFLTKISALLPDKSIGRSKEEWNTLAGENHKYYIVSKKGRQISEEEFRATGEENYREVILGDEQIRARIAPFGDKRVLDIGCGAGRLVEFFAKDFASVEGVDISEKMVEEAKKRLGHVSNAHFTATDGMHYPFPDNSFDLVFSYIVFQHMPSEAVIRENLKEVRRVLKPTGIAKIQFRGGHKVRKGTWFYGPTFNKESTRKMLTEVGLTTLEMGDDSVKRFWLWLTK